MSVRWECPSGKHPGVLGPERPRRENVVRYCLRCSEETGKLVERVAPALERKRAAKAAARREAPARREASLRQRSMVLACNTRGDVVEVDVLGELESMAAMLDMKPPMVTIQRRSRSGTTSGRATYEDHRIHLSVWGDISKTPGRLEDLIETALHEVVHLKAGKCGRDHHGPRFKRLLADAARERWPGIEFDEAPAMHSGRAYDLDDLIVKALKEYAT